MYKLRKEGLYMYIHMETKLKVRAPKTRDIVVIPLSSTMYVNVFLYVCVL